MSIIHELIIVCKKSIIFAKKIAEMKKADFTYDIDKHTMFLYSQMPERLRRLYVGLEAMKAGYSGVAKVSEQFNVHKHTVRRGKIELLQEIVPPAKRIRQKGGGRKKRL
jgi:hypothetical protein